MRKVFIRMIICALFLPSFVCAADYYVDADATGSNNGTSKTNAWQSFADINWSTVNTGNGKLFVCGTHSETMTVTTSGEVGVPIQIVSCTIANGASADDPGIIDGGNTRQNGISVTDRNYITIDGLTIQNHAGNGSAIWFYSASGSILSPTIKNVTISAPRARGITCRRCYSGLVEDSTIDAGQSGVDPADAADAVYMPLGSDNTIDGCTIYQRTNTGSDHNDCIQTANSTNFTVKNSFVQQVAAGNNSSQVVMCDEGFGTITLYNNVFLGNTTGNGVLFYNSGAWTADVYLWNNYFSHPRNTDGRAFSANIPAGDVKEIKNNIFVASGTDSHGLFLNNTPSDKTGIDYNLYYVASGVHAQISGTQYTNWATYNSAGYDANGIHSQDPSLDANYAPDASADPVVDAGTTIASFSTDKSGFARPQGAAWDIGAYEFEATASPVHTIIGLNCSGCSH